MNREIPVSHLVRYIWKARLRIVAFTSVITLLSAVWLISLPNRYTAQAVFVAESVEGETGLSSIASSFGGVASLAGISLGSDNQTAVEAEYLLTSESFLLSIVKDFGFLPQVVAALDYDFSVDSLEYDDSMYSPENDTWTLQGEQKSRFGNYPADWYIISKLREMVSLAKDDETGLLTLSVEHLSPYFSKQFATLMVSEINRVMKQRESEQLSRRLDFLTEQLNAEMPSEIRQSIYALLEQQLKQKMIVETSENFIFKVIEQPQIPERKSSPLRSLLLITMLIAAAAASVLYYTVKCIFLSFNHDELR